MHQRLLIQISALLLVALAVHALPASVPNTTESEPANTTLGDIEQYHNQKKSCSHHSECSCIGGIPICHNGFCNCVIAIPFCLTHNDCAVRCQHDIGVCLGNGCKCYKLVEDRKMSESLYPMSYDEDLK
ncbi:uncharacterized protein [Haliotis asinina]|uniref:uncharacterized protein n=1 Tax=Haliotis asinina TaxID=109174 RepID=UPI0035324A80